MPKTTTALETPLRDQLDRLAAFTPSGLPVISLYLNMKPDQNGRPNFEPFLRKTFGERAMTFKADARKSFERDVQRINTFLGNDVKRSANGLVIFACAGVNDFFETIQLDVPLGEHWMFIGSVPHLYPLARLNDQFPRYAALLIDTNSARLFVFSLGTTEAQQNVQNVKTRKSAMGGWSQARYQRHLENFHLHHIKEVVDVLDKVVREESINHLVVSGDEVAVPKLRQQLPKHLAEKVIDIVRVDKKAPDSDVLQQTLDALRQLDAKTDAERVDQMIGAWRSNGLAVVGPEATLAALQLGQVEELLITATPALLKKTKELPDDAAPGPVDVDTSGSMNVDPDRLKLADELVTKAQQTAARIRFIENPELLQDVGGVGAILRFRIS
jgi:peptide subunit release factor 1 (eRF1)